MYQLVQRNRKDQEGSDSWDEREKESHEQLLVFSLSQVDGFTSSLIDAACKTPEVTAGWCLSGPSSSLAHFLLCENGNLAVVCNLAEGAHQTPAGLEPDPNPWSSEE